MSRNIIRELLVRLGVAVDPKTKAEIAAYSRSVEKVKGQLQDVGEYALRAGKYLAGLAIGGAVAIGALAISTGQHAIAVETQARALQLTRKEFQEYEAVFARFGADSSQISEAFLQLNEKAVDAAGGSETVAKEFALIGIRIDELKGKRPSDVFELLADKIAGAADKNKALAAASRLLGEDTAKKLLPALVQGGAAIRGMRLEADKLGVVMSDRQLAASKAAAEQWRQLTMRATGLRNELGAALAPVVERVVRGVVAWVTANRALLSQRIEAFASMIGRAFTAADTAARLVGGWDAVFRHAATGAGMLFLLANLDNLTKLLGGVRVAVVALEVAFAPVAAAIGVPLGAVALAVAGLAFFIGLAALAVDDYLTFWRGGQSVLGTNLDLIQSYIPAFGAVRELVGSVALLFLQLVTNAKGFATTIGTILAPELERLAALLAPIRDTFWAIWQAMNAMAGTKIGVLTDIVQRMTGATADMGSRVSSEVGATMSGAVQDQQAQRVGGVLSSDNSVRTSTVNATFHGASVNDVDLAIASSHRKAALTLAGTRR